ncbi:MAG: M3 family metallopeptidase [Sporocytophaga sp.]|uniref:M3 family metallopeptidase n=1 Tax=Sporocytophaga sp. TaxID=2231183 RepID=UPI001B08E291|nr:M3 family metallopeptidase [Sporocytophaga sp.]MBO9703360.1 M3 family metallopeptidase [Sporocytophaga sp.]
MNPLLQSYNTPFGTIPFDQIKNEHFLPAIKEAIALGKEDIKRITASKEVPDFENTIVALERSGELVGSVSSVFFNLNSAETNDEIQKLAREISPLLSEYSNDILLDQELFVKIKTVYDKKDKLTLTPEQNTLLAKTYKSFVRNGANLSEDKKLKLREIDKDLSQLSLLFGEHVLKETNDFFMEVTDEKQLSGLPPFVVEAAAIAAKEKGKEGWIFTLQFPSYIPFMTYADDRALREKMFYAFGSKAFKGDDNDNKKIVLDIVRLRHERANLLGYKSHADFVLEERMAESPSKVSAFLDNLLKYAKPIGEKELKELSDYARSIGGPEKLARWDISYYSEKLKKEKYSIDDEMLKPYFKLENVIDGVFQVSGKLYGLKFKEINNVQVYHPDVKVYEVLDEQDKHVAVFYADFFPRAGKRNGAWMTSFRGQKKVNGNDIRPHVSIVCNFTKPTGTQPSLLTFNEVTTLFHEFGHALHGMLANGTYESLSGTSVYWDFVELPSQVFENWVYEKDSLDLFAKHYETGAAIPLDLIKKIKESANFMEAYQTVRQVGLAQLDMGWHSGKALDVKDVGAYEKELQKATDLLPAAEGANTSCSFSHIFQGGYSSGYYSYKWAEVLDADAFEFFQEKGIFNKDTATLFKTHVLSAGGSEHPMELYKRFRGKEPSPEALLRRTGMLN